VTDVEVGRREEHSPQSRQRYFDKEERPQFQQRPQERIQEKPPQDQSRPQRETRRLRVVNGYVDFTKDGSI